MEKDFYSGFLETGEGAAVLQRKRVGLGKIFYSWGW